MANSNSPQSGQTGANNGPAVSGNSAEPTQVNAMKATIVGADPSLNETKTNMNAPSSSENPKPAPKKKSTQLGDFKLKKRLGKGGMGEVFLAQQVSLDRPVAIKTLSKELASKPGFVERFLREARSMARLQHQNIVQVYAADSVKGIHYVAIEYIDGRSMQDWMDQNKTLSLGDALHVVLVCAEALKQAHDQNMIHRDIKPDNILVTSKGVVKVADFGLAKAVDEDVSMTQSGTGLGTPLYMAPEQARNAKHVDLRTDIYALGCTLYYFLTGQLPFTGKDTLELILAKEKGTFKSARSISKEVPERLDLMIDKMLAKDPAHRYASCQEIIQDLGGLGLQNPALSFIAGSVPNPSVGSPSMVSRGAVTQAPGGQTMAQTATNQKLPPPPGKASEPLTSRADATRTDMSQSMVSSKTWFVKFVDAKGKTNMSKFSTEQVIKGIKSGMFDKRSRAREGNQGPFVPLTQFNEFEGLMHQRLAQASVNAKGKQAANMMQKLAAQEDRRRRWKWLKNLMFNIKGGIGLLIYLIILAVLVGGIWVAFLFREEILAWFTGA